MLTLEGLFRCFSGRVDRSDVGLLNAIQKSEEIRDPMLSGLIYRCVSGRLCHSCVGRISGPIGRLRSDTAYNRRLAGGSLISSHH